MTTTAARSADGVLALMAHPDFRRLKRRVIEATGLQYYADKDQVLAERIQHRRLALDCEAGDYVARLLDPANREELAGLIDDITIGETYFFRYPEQFEALRQTVIPDCIARRRRERTLRIWSAGCASGAEIYSLAILIQREFADQLAGWRVSMLGTDINRKALDQARSGVFSNWELRRVTEEQRRQCFVESGKHWIIRPEYRKSVEFRHQNLAEDIDGFARANAGVFDILLCRNVMIYFAAGLMRRLLRAFNDCLSPGGWLLVGHAEPYFEIANFFTPVSVAGATLYRQGGDGAQPSPAPAWSPDPALADAGERDDGAPGEWVATLLDPVVPPPMPPAAGGGFEAAPFSGGLSPDADAPNPGDGAAASPAAPAPAAPPLAALEEIRRHSDAGAWNVAIEACEQALRRHPLEAPIYHAYALIAEHVGMSTAAEQALGRAIYLDRDFALAHYHLGRCQANRGDVKAAARSFSNALKVVAGRDDDDPLTMGDGLTAGELRRLARTQLRLLGQHGGDDARH